MLNFVAEKAKELKIKPGDCEISSVTGGLLYAKVKYSKKKELLLNNLIQEKIFEDILNKKVKVNFGSWAGFNTHSKKSHRNKSSIVKKIVAINEMLSDLNLKIYLKDIEERKTPLK